MPGIKDGLTEKKELDTKMSIKHKIKFKKIDRDRGTSPAELRSSGPKHSAERPASKLGVKGESIRRDVSLDDKDYVKKLTNFYKGK